MSSLKKIGKPIIISIIILLPHLLIPGNARGGTSQKNADQIIYMFLRTAILDSLTNALDDSTSKIDRWDIVRIAGRALDAKAEDLKKNNDWISKNDLWEKVSEISGALENLIKKADKPLVKKTGIDPQEITQAYLVGLLRESSALGLREEYSHHPLSDYKFILGGSWTHADSGAAKGIVAASLLFRTRLFDSRGSLDQLRPKDPERWYLDLAVNADFITNTAYNRVTPDTTDNDPTRAEEVLLESVVSSKLSMALFSRIPLTFADYATFGPFIRFEISTQEGSGDIFRRFITGIRVENRSRFIIRGTAAEVGFTANNAAGSRQSNVIIGKFDRIVLNFELPLRGKADRGMYIKFHGEWPIGSKDEILNIASGKKEEISPPVYQFQVGALFDPLDLFGPIFGVK